MDDGPVNPLKAVRRFVDLLTDAREVEARRRRNGGVEARADAPPGSACPAYSPQNFHFQTGGWFPPRSARPHEGQVESLVAGAAGAPRRPGPARLATAL